MTAVSTWENDTERGEDLCPIDHSSKKMLWAAETGALDTVKTILAETPELVHVKDKDGYTPLHRACYNDHVPTVDILLECGANHDARTEDEWQPLHSACKWNNARSAAKLLEHGADINAASLGGQTPLHLAASNTHAKDTLTLLLMSPNLNSGTRNNSNETAAELAQRCGQYHSLFEIVEECVTKI